MRPFHLLFPLFILSSTTYAQLGFSPDNYREVDPTNILQFFGSRCTTSTAAATPADLALHYSPTPTIDLYFEDPSYGQMWYLKSLPLDSLHTEWQGTYFAVVPDEAKPGLLKLDTRTQTAELRVGCALHFSPIPPFID